MQHNAVHACIREHRIEVRPLMIHLLLCWQVCLCCFPHWLSGVVSRLDTNEPCSFLSEIDMLMRDEQDDTQLDND